MLSDELKRLRKERGLTQSQLAEALNVSQSTIASWENGTRQPTTDFLPTLAEFYGISTDRILGMIAELQLEPETPRTEEARILMAGVDRMPEADRKKALDIMCMVFDKYKSYFERADDDGT